MEDLVKRQESVFDEVQKLYQNYNKQGDVRRTASSVKNRLELLNELLEEFNDNDQELQQYMDVNPTHPYNQDRKSCVQYYKNFKEKLESRLQVIDPSFNKNQRENQTTTQKPTTSKSTDGNIQQKIETTAATTSSTTEQQQFQQQQQLQQHQKQQQLTKQQQNDEVTTMDKKLHLINYKLSKISSILISLRNELNYPESKSFFQLKTQFLNKLWEETSRLFDDIMMISIDNQISNLTLERRFEQLETEVYDALALLRSRIDSFDTKIETKLKPQQLKLAPIEIPKFYGDFKKWSEFRDLFQKTIHENVDIHKVHKMNYLKTYTAGEASRVISHLTCTENHYDTAWQLLAERFDNKRAIVQNLITTLVNQPNMTIESVSALKTLHDTTVECLSALKNQNLEIETWDQLLIHLINSKLAVETKMAYEDHVEHPKQLQTFNDLLKFIEKRFLSLQTTNFKRPVTAAPKNEKPIKQNVFITQTQNEQPQCTTCTGKHKIETCPNFINKPTIERVQVVHLLNLCRNCLQSGHGQNKCVLKNNCDKCNGQHHKLLHTNFEKPKSQQNGKTTSKNDKGMTVKSEGNKTRPTTSAVNSAVLADNQSSQVLLGTVRVKVVGKDGEEKIIRALVDPGSEVTLITENTVKMLNLKGKKFYAEISGIGDTKAGLANKKVTLEIQSNLPNKYKLQLEALVFKNLTKTIPENSIRNFQWPHLENLQLADPQFNIAGPIDMLIGADYYTEILLGDVIKAGVGKPMAQSTKLGWIVIGTTGISTSNRLRTMITSVEIDKQLKQFWEIEELHPTRSKTEEEQACEEFYKLTHTRKPNGKYVVRIPFKMEPSDLGESRNRAIARFLQLEKQFQRQENFALEYKTCIQEYIDLGHMKLTTQTNAQDKGYVIPHHAVIKNESLTTKLRVVFDASAKTTTNVSLNDIQMVGPTIQDDLLSILIRCRKHKILFIADIEKMYRQISIHDDDQKFQKILWRESNEQPIQEYQLTTVTFGMSSAPYLAIKTLQQLAKDEADIFPIASSIVLNDFYVDDLISGSDSIHDARLAQIQIIKLLQRGGFHLRKWMSNSVDLLKDLPENLKSDQPFSIILDKTVKTLGLQYQPNSDCFEFKLEIGKEQVNITKRILLSEASKLFDPLGWLAPIIVQAKLMLQETWLAGLNWDDQLPPLIEAKWQKYRKELCSINQIKIPRWIQHNPNQKGQLHGFCDASERAYAAAVYYSTENAKGIKTTTLVTAKTKVAPIKTKISLPRLELCGAVLLTALLRKVETALKINPIKITAWTDSMIVLAWVKGNPNNYKTFIANRVAEIQNVLAPSQWNHVPSLDNPADCATRGIDANKLVSHTLWWTGPSWLNESISTWPSTKLDETNLSLPELKRVFIAERRTNVFEALFEKYSSLDQIQRIVGYCLRFIKRTRSKSPILNQRMSIQELRNAMTKILFVIQRAHFTDEIVSLERKQRVNAKSKILALTPFLDENGILRVGGRLQNSNCSYNQKHSILIPQKHQITTMIIRDAHRYTLHGGGQLTLMFIRNNFWIINGRNCVRLIIKDCPTCQVLAAKPAVQIMGNLPAERVVPSRPFSKVGVDYAGPMQVRTTKGRGHKSYKGYLAIFVCMSTKAIHIEVVSDMTTETFIAALKRFVARRGICSDIYSDNGTNFVGANNNLCKELKLVLKETNELLVDWTTKLAITWHFIPPAAPHFGGLWESAVKSVKHHLKRVIGETTLTYEELTTLVCQIEACVNSRPLTPMSNDPNDHEALTPGHFLVGESLITIPKHNLNEIKINSLGRWKLIENIKKDFWNRWSKEYLHILQQRYKWPTIEDNLKVGDLVLVREDNLPPTKWLKGRVVQLHSGKDQQVRVASVQTSNQHIIKRPIVKLSLLKFESPLNKENSTLKNKYSLLDKSPLNKENSALKNKDCSLDKNPAPLNRTVNFGVFRSPVYTILALFLIFGAACSSNITITQFHHQPGIYYERMGTANIIEGNWKIIVFFNLENYWQEFYEYKKTVLDFRNLCTDIVILRNACHYTLNELNNIWAQISHNNDLLFNIDSDSIATKRKVRSLEVFGVLDISLVNEYKNVIAQVNKNENYLLKLMQNQTSLIDSTVNMFKHSIEQVNTQLNDFAKYIDSVVKKILSDYELVKANLEFDIRTLQVSIMMMRFQEIQQEMIELLSEIHNGVYNKLLMTNNQFLKELKKIENYMPRSMIVSKEPKAVHDLIHFFKQIKTRARLTTDLLIVEATIPLKTREQFTLYRLIPVPTLFNDIYVFVEPAKPYLLIGSQFYEYALLTEADVTRCKVEDHQAYVCELRQPFQINGNDAICEVNLLMHKNDYTSCNIQHAPPESFFTPLTTANVWIFSVAQMHQVNVICGSWNEVVSLEGTGVLQIKPPCNLKDKHIVIKSVITNFTEIYAPITSAINITTFINNNTHKMNVSKFSFKFVENETTIENQIRQQQADEASTDLTIHDIHHYALGFTSIGFWLILIIMVIVWCKCCRNRITAV